MSLTLPPRDVAQPSSARFRVVPTLAGSLQVGASSLTPVDQPELVFHVPPGHLSGALSRVPPARVTARLGGSPNELLLSHAVAENRSAFRCMFDDARGLTS